MTAKREFLQDLDAMLTEAEDLLKRASVETGDRADVMRSQVETKLLEAKLRLHRLEGEAMRRAAAVSRAANGYAHENPWRLVGIAAGIGLAAGLLLTRRNAEA